MSASARIRLAAICLMSLTLANCFARTSSSIRIFEQSAFYPEAQTDTCMISGIVLDENKFSLPGITVKIWSGQGMLREVTSDNTGRFSFVGLAPGTYHVAAELDGFKKANLDELIVVVHSDTRLEIMMRPDPDFVFVVT